MYVVREKELRSAVSPLEKRRADSAPKAEALGVPRRHFLSLLLFLFAVSSLWAVDPSRHISQYAHTTWRIQDGVFSGAPHAITQTTDGYLWIGTEAGPAALRWRAIRSVDSSRWNASAVLLCLFSFGCARWESMDRDGRWSEPLGQSAPNHLSDHAGTHQFHY